MSYRAGLLLLIAATILLSVVLKLALDTVNMPVRGVSERGRETW